jgi:membrane-bound lytic murein transglycosylase D
MAMMNISGGKCAAVGLLCLTVTGTGCALQPVDPGLSSFSFFNDLPLISWLTSEDSSSHIPGSDAVASVADDNVQPNADVSPDAVVAEPNNAVAARLGMEPGTWTASGASIGSSEETTANANVVGRVGADGGPEVVDLSIRHPESIASANVLDTTPPKTRAVKAQKESSGPSTDVWQRIRKRLSMGDAERKEVRPHIAWLKKHPRYFKHISKRARPYLHYIVEQVEARNMPAEMALVPIVESGFQPFAYSGSGAAGLWQIIPSTGRYLGLKQNWWYDGRRDVVGATRAALDYLETLHAQFDDWELAFAAYNCGAGTVSRAQARNAAKGKPTDFWSIRALLPKETRSYVPRLIAIAAALEHPEAFGIDVPVIPNKKYFKVVPIGSQIDMSVAAEASGVELTELLALNPGFKRWATDPDGPHRLLVPAASASVLRAAIAGLSADERVTWRVHTIGNGETLGQIARKYDTRVDVLKTVNKLNTSRIRSGKTLMVPTGNPGAAAVQQVRANLKRGKRTSGGTTRQGTSRAAAARRHQALGPPPAGLRWYTVAAGDSLWSISRRHETRVATMVRNNRLAKGTVLKPGQRVLVPTKAGQVARATTNGPVKVKTAVDRRIYPVRAGDSLWTIAKRLGVGVRDLAEWNSLQISDTLQPGQRLYLSAPDGQRQS